MLEWKSEYSTGVEEIDEQHRVLFQYINDLEETVEGERSSGYVSVVLQFLDDYAKSHFGYEENCMREHHCPVAVQNKHAHDRFLSEFSSFQERYRKEPNKKKLLKDIHLFMHDWLVNHICKIDTHLKDCQKMHS